MDNRPLNTSSPIEFLNEAENNKELQEEIREFLTDENITKAIKAEIGEDVKEDEPFFNVDLSEIEEIEEESEEIGFADSPLLIGYIHVWKEQED